MLEAGATIPELQCWLGHSTPTQSLAYAKAALSAGGRNAAALSANYTAA